MLPTTMKPEDCSQACRAPAWNLPSNPRKSIRTIMRYIGGYYQWPNDRKIKGRVGMQSFGGRSSRTL